MLCVLPTPHCLCNQFSLSPECAHESEFTSRCTYSSLFFIDHKLCVESGVRHFQALFCAFAAFTNGTPAVFFERTVSETVSFIYLPFKRQKYWLRNPFLSWLTRAHCIINHLWLLLHNIDRTSVNIKHSYVTALVIIMTRVSIISCVAHSSSCCCFYSMISIDNVNSRATC